VSQSQLETQSNAYATINKLPMAPSSRRSGLIKKRNLLKKVQATESKMPQRFLALSIYMVFSEYHNVDFFKQYNMYSLQLYWQTERLMNDSSTENR
jgi:hypothetical protein